MRCARASRASPSASRSTSRTTCRRRRPASTRRTPSRSPVPISTRCARSPSRSAACWRRCAASRHPGAAAARPAHHQDRHRPPARRALRPVARRHQRHHPGRRRRPGGGRPLRGRQRPPLPHAGAAGAAIPPEHGGAPAHRHRRARAERRRRPGAARRGGQYRPVDRRLLYLPRAAGALHPGEVQRARPRPRRRRARGAGEGGRRGQAAERLSPRLGGRLRQFRERHGAACHRRADRHRPDPAAALCQLRLPGRHADRRQRHPDGADRRHPGPVRWPTCRSASRPPSASSPCSASPP